MSIQKRNEKIVREWLGGYVAVGEALTRLHEGKKGVEFAVYVTEEFGLSYHRAIQIELASVMATHIGSLELPTPHNEALAYRLHRLATAYTSDLGSDVEGAEEKGVAVAIELWKSVLTENKKPTVNILNKAIAAKFPKSPKPEPKVKTAQDFIGLAVVRLTEARNLVEAKSEPVDLRAVEELVASIKLLITPAVSIAA